MDMFLVKFLLCSVALRDLPHVDPKVRKCRVEATASPDTPSNFWTGIPANERRSYQQFAEEIVRIEVNTDTKVNVFYLAFRCARDSRPDLGVNKYTLAKPSSIELGYCPSAKQGYQRLLKKHYTDYPAATDEKTLVKALGVDIFKTILNNLI